MTRSLAILERCSFVLPAARRPAPPPGFYVPGAAVFGRWRMTPIEAIDAELAKLAPVLRAARMAEDHARGVKWLKDADDLLDRRLALSAVTRGGQHGSTR